jgi:hypothetical protein
MSSGDKTPEKKPLTDGKTPGPKNPFSPTLLSPEQAPPQDDVTPVKKGYQEGKARRRRTRRFRRRRSTHRRRRSSTKLPK